MKIQYSYRFLKLCLIEVKDKVLLNITKDNQTKSIVLSSDTVIDMSTIINYVNTILSLNERIIKIDYKQLDSPIIDRKTLFVDLILEIKLSIL